MSNKKMPVNITYGDPYDALLRSHASSAGSDSSSSAASISAPEVSTQVSSIPELCALDENLKPPYFFPPSRFHPSSDHLVSINKVQRMELTGQDPNDPNRRHAKVIQKGKPSKLLHEVSIRASKSPQVGEVYVNNPTEDGENYISTHWPDYSLTTDLGPAHATGEGHSEDCQKHTRTVEGQGRCYCSASNANENKKGGPSGKK